MGEKWKVGSETVDVNTSNETGSKGSVWMVGGEKVQVGGTPAPTNNGFKVNLSPNDPTQDSIDMQGMAGAPVPMGLPPNVGAGLVKGALSTMFHGGDIIRRVLGMDRPVQNNPEVQDLITPQGGGQKLGFGLEQAGEYFMPLPGEKKAELAIKGMPLVKRLVLGGAKDAVKTGSVAAVQSGGDKGATVGGAVVGGVGGTAARGVGAGVEAGWNRLADMTRNNPKLASGMARIKAWRYGNKSGIPVNPSVRTGSTQLGTIQKSVSSGPLAPTAEDLVNAQDLGFEQKAADVLNRVSGGRPVQGRYEAGGETWKRLERLRNRIKGLEDQHWNGFRANQKLTGQQIDVDRTQIQSQLQPIWDDIKNTLGPEDPAYRAMQEIMELGQTKTVGTPPTHTTATTTRSVTPAPKTAPATQVAIQTNGTVQANTHPAQPFSSYSTSRYTHPGVKVTTVSKNTPGNQRVVQVGGEKVVDINTALSDLSNLAKLSRTINQYGSRNGQQGLAAKVLKEYHQIVEDAVRRVSPAPPSYTVTMPSGETKAVVKDSPLLEVLKKARNYTKQRIEVEDMMDAVAGPAAYGQGPVEYGRVLNKLVQNDDASANLLGNLSRMDRGSIPAIASSTLRDILDMASKSGAEKSFAGGRAAESAWMRLGPKSKQILYGTNMTRELDNLLRLGRFLAENPQPSNTAPVTGFIARLWAMTKHPLWAVKEGGLEYALGKYLFSSGGPANPLPYVKNVSQAGFNQLPSGARVAGRVAQGLSALDSRGSAAAIGAAFRAMTGIDPAQFSNTDQSSDQSSDVSIDQSQNQQ